MASDMCPAYAPFFSALGVVSSIVFSSFGASYGTAKASIGAFSAGVIRPDLSNYMLLPTVFAGILAIYGLIASVLIANHVQIEMSLFTSLINFGTGLAVGLCGMASGFTIGIAGDAGVRSLAQQPKMFVSMVLILIFGEVLGLYGLVVGLILDTKANDGGICRRL